MSLQDPDNGLTGWKLDRGDGSEAADPALSVRPPRHLEQ